MADYNLKLFTPIKQGKKYMGDITHRAEGWRRSIRLQGGYWIGSFVMGGKLEELRDFYYTMLGAHIEEYSPMKTWEGHIWNMTWTDGGRYRLQVQCAGYVFRLQDKVVSSTVQSNTRCAVSTWFEELFAEASSTGIDPDFVKVGRIDSNDLQQYRKVQSDKSRHWDEFKFKTEMGDSEYNLWRAYVDNDNSFVYEKVNAEPRYIVYGGLVRRRSFDDVYNYVTGEFTETDGNSYPIPAKTNDYSIDRFGKIMEYLELNNMSTTEASNLSTTYMREHAWPWSKTMTSAPTLNLFSVVGDALGAIPWRIKPAVIRDGSYTVKGQDAPTDDDYWLSDRRDFIAEEVECSVDGGLVIRSLGMDESEIMEARIKYLNANRKEPPAPKRVQRYPGCSFSWSKEDKEELLGWLYYQEHPDEGGAGIYW